MDVKAVQVKLGKRRLIVGERYLGAVKGDKKALAGDDAGRDESLLSDKTHKTVNIIEAPFDRFW